MRPAYLRTLGRDAPDALIEIDFRARRSTNLARTGKGQCAEFQRRAERRPAVFSTSASGIGGGDFLRDEPNIVVDRLAKFFKAIRYSLLRVT